MTTLGITATRALSLEEHWALATIMAEELVGYDRYVTGGCRGGDHVLGLALATVYPHARHTVVLPANRSQVHDWWTGCEVDVEVLEMPPGTSYKQRNQRIVDLSDDMGYVAEFPEAHGRSRRSGTWQTVRLARDAETPIDGIILSQLE